MRACVRVRERHMSAEEGEEEWAGTERDEKSMKQEEKDRKHQEKKEEK